MGLALRAVATALLAGLPACGEDAAMGHGEEGPGARRPVRIPDARPHRGLYRDVTDAAGLDFAHVRGATGRKYLPETMGAGACALDFDGDGLMDVYLVQSGEVPQAPQAPDGARDARNRLFRNQGDGTFVDVTEGSGAGDRGYGQGVVAADYDGDGDTDLYLVNFGPNVLLRNEGNGTFTDVTGPSGTGDPLWGSSAAFFDADGDGDLDLYVVNYLDFAVAKHIDCGRLDTGEPAYCHPDAYKMAPDRFYRNRGDGTFEDATVECGFEDRTGKGLGVVVSDIDLDGDQDVYVANDSTPNFLYENQGGGRFLEKGVLSGTSHNEDGKTEAGMGTDAGDVNGDGFPDLFVTNLTAESNSLYLGGGAVGFRYATRTWGLAGPSLPYVGFGTDLLDVDNDGDLDIYVANGHVIDNIHLSNDAFTWKQPDQVFLNTGRGAFRELAAGKAGEISVPRAGRGQVTLDYDNDGRLDVLVTHSEARARLYRNECRSGGGWIGFLLVGRGGNRDAVGARVTVVREGGSLTEERRAGASYQCSHDPRMHFGLGDADAAQEVRITWPGGSRQILGGLPGGSYYRVVQGEQPEPLGAAYPATMRKAR